MYEMLNETSKNAWPSNFIQDNPERTYPVMKRIYSELFIGGIAAHLKM